MGFLDDVQSFASKGMASANRAASSTKLKLQQSDLLRQRKELAAQLGATLYEATKDNSEWRNGRESLYDAIAELDAQRSDIEAEIARLEQQAEAQAQAAITYTCSNCGAPVHQGDAFCSGCGKPVVIEPAKDPFSANTSAATEEAYVCKHCGAGINKGDLFCMSCGQRQDEEPAAPKPSMEQDTVDNSAEPETLDATNTGDETVVADTPSAPATPAPTE